MSFGYKTFSELIVSLLEQDEEEELFNFLLAEFENEELASRLKNKDGSDRKVNRTDYSRMEKRQKIEGDPWTQVN